MQAKSVSLKRSYSQLEGDSVTESLNLPPVDYETDSDEFTSSNSVNKPSVGDQAQNITSQPGREDNGGFVHASDSGSPSADSSSGDDEPGTGEESDDEDAESSSGDGEPGSGEESGSGDDESGSGEESGSGDDEQGSGEESGSGDDEQGSGEESGSGDDESGSGEESGDEDAGSSSGDQESGTDGSEGSSTDNDEHAPRKLRVRVVASNSETSFRLWQLDENGEPNGVEHTITGINVRCSESCSFAVAPNHVHTLVQLVKHTEGRLKVLHFEEKIPFTDKNVGRIVMVLPQPVQFLPAGMIRAIVLDYDPVYQHLWEFSDDGLNRIFFTENGSVHANLKVGQETMVFTKMHQFFLTLGCGRLHLKQLRVWSKNVPEIIRFFRDACPYIIYSVFNSELNDVVVNRISWFLRPGYVGQLGSVPVRNIIAISMTCKEVDDDVKNFKIVELWKEIMAEPMDDLNNVMNPSLGVLIVQTWGRFFEAGMRGLDFEVPDKYNGPFMRREFNPVLQPRLPDPYGLELYGIVSTDGLRMAAYLGEDASIVVRGEFSPGLFRVLKRETIQVFGLNGYSQSERYSCYSYRFYCRWTLVSEVQPFIDAMPALAETYHSWRGTIATA